MAINTAQSLVLRTQGLPHGKNKRTSACISKMKAKFLSCGKRSTKNQGEQLQLVVVEAKGACVRRKLGAPISRRRCGSHPKYAHSVYKNALNKFSFIRLRQRRAHQADNLAELWQEFLSMLELIAKIFCAVEIVRTSAVDGNRHFVFNPI